MELVGGAYSARSPIANAQKCVNLFPESNRSDGPLPKVMTHYQRPGLRLKWTPASAVPARGAYCASNGVGFYVAGNMLYQGSQSSNATWTAIGQLGTSTGAVSMIDNGIDLWLVDGTPTSYRVSLASGAFTILIDPTGTFTGAKRVDILDTFVLWPFLNSNLFGSSISGNLQFNNLFFAAKVGYPDNLQTLWVNMRNILLIGKYKSELWYDAGNQNFPFALLPGAYIEHGCLAINSVAAFDTNVVWLSQTLQGQNFIVRQRGYVTDIISNYALSYAINQMKRKGADLSDAIAYTYTQEGHAFYVITFQSGDQTWVYDLSINDPMNGWHQRGWTDPSGALHRERAQCRMYVNGEILVGDWQNGQLYALDPDHFTDDVINGVSGPINYTRTFPKIQSGMSQGQPVLSDGRNLRLTKFVADIECGNGPVDTNGLPPQVGLRVSLDHGKTFGNYQMQSTGEIGEYSTQPKFAPMNLGRFPVLELNYSFAGQAALNGGWIDAEVGNN
jgi:hypothetical protein